MRFVVLGWKQRYAGIDCGSIFALVCRFDKPPMKIKVRTTLFAEALNSQYSRKWLNAMELELENKKAN